LTGNCGTKGYCVNLPFSYNRISDSEHNEIYDEMIQRLTAMAERNERNDDLINVLTLDGGGIRGLVIIHMLMAVEKVLDEPVFKYFDLVGGTSTGALVSISILYHTHFRNQ
jgi:predicted patatin/cPLA2 family phospholipase